MVSTTDLAVAGLTVAAASLYIFRDQIFTSSSSKPAAAAPSGSAEGGGDDRNFVSKLKAAVRSPLRPRIPLC
jgi:NADPH-ferrihemoprotein reductase